MTHHDFSSGDLIADRRAEYAAALAEKGDFANAAALLAEALDMVPDWAAGWARLGDYRREAGAIEAALEAYQLALRHDPADHMGAGLQIDLLRRVPVTGTMPRAFVETLFDQYAPRFDAALVDKLGYRVPEMLRDGLLMEGHTRFDRVMDLGCGTGLMGAAIRPLAGWLAGVDLSAGMLRQARAKGLYDQLEKGDIARLSVADPGFDLILAADVFIYLGALEQVIGWAAASLTRGGLLAFSVEEAGADEGDFILRPSRRYAHARTYIARLLQRAGLAPLSIAPITVRCDRDDPIAGLQVIARADQAMAPA